MPQSLDNLLTRLDELKIQYQSVMECENRFIELKSQWYEDVNNEEIHKAYIEAERKYRVAQSWQTLKVARVLDAKRELELLGVIRTDG